LATWLAQRLVSGPRTDSLLGDLMEQYGEGRSRVWYWRQTLAAIAVSVTADVRDRPFSAGRTLLVGWALYAISAACVVRAVTAIRYFAADMCFWVGWSSPPPACPSRFDNVLVETLSRLLATLSCVAIGWMLARLNRRQHPAFVLLFAMSLFLVEYGVTVFMLARYSQNPPAVTTIILLGVIGLGRPGGVLLGGLRPIQPPAARGVTQLFD